MDLIEKICSLPAPPHLSAHVSAFQYIWQTVQQVQGIQEQLRELVHCIAQILQSLDQEHRAARLLENETAVPLEHIDRYVIQIRAIGWHLTPYLSGYFARFPFLLRRRQHDHFWDPFSLKTTELHGSMNTIAKSPI